MKARRTIVLLVALFALLLPTPTLAITGGTLDESAHPNVGAVIAVYTPIGEDAIVWCSGTLVAPTLFLTAAHCLAEDADPTILTILGVTFDPVPVDPETGDVDMDTVIPVAADGLRPHPGYPGPASDPLDIAIIELAPDRPLEIAPALLPSRELFDEMAQKNGLHGQEFTAVGYGSTGREHEPGSGSPTFEAPDARMHAVSTFQALDKAWLRLSMNPSTGDGGTCYGDSGGPNFLGAGDDETDVIAAITITGDAVCRATNVVYRLDSSSAQTFLAAFGLVESPTTAAAPATTTDRNQADVGKAKADKGKAKKASNNRDGKKRRGDRRIGPRN